MNTIDNLIHFNQNACFTLSPNKHIRGIEEMGGYLWIGTESGVVRLNRTTGETKTFNMANSALSSYTIEGITVFPNQSGGAHHRDVIGVIHYDERINIIDDDNTVKEVKEDNFNACLCMEVQQVNSSRQIIWVGQPKGLAKVVNNNWASPESITAFEEKTVRYLLVSRDNTKIWAATTDAMYLSENQGNSWTKIPIRVRNVAADRQYGNPASGVFPLTSENIHVIYEAENRENKGIYIGTPTGVYKYNEKRRTFLSFGQLQRAVLAITEVDDKLLFGCSNGLYDINGTDYGVAPLAPIRTLYKDATNTIWVGFLRDGLYYLNDNQLVAQPLANFTGAFQLPETNDQSSARMNNRVYTIENHTKLKVVVSGNGTPKEIQPTCITTGSKLLALAATGEGENSALWILAEAVKNYQYGTRTPYSNTGATTLIHVISTAYLKELEGSSASAVAVNDY